MDYNDCMSEVFPETPVPGVTQCDYNLIGNSKHFFHAINIRWSKKTKTTNSGAALKLNPFL